MVEKVLRGMFFLMIGIMVISSGFQAAKIASSAQDSPGWAPVEQVMGKQGALQGDVLKFSMPRGAG